MHQSLHTHNWKVIQNYFNISSKKDMHIIVYPFFIKNIRVFYYVKFITKLSDLYAKMMHLKCRMAV